MSISPVMVEARASRSKVRRAYNLYSWFYGPLIAQMEKKARHRGLDLARISKEDRILEVAVGSGNTFLEMAFRKGTAKGLSGLDLSPRMVQVSKKRMERNGFPDVDLREGDACQLPFPGAHFDLLVNSYMLDLIPLQEMEAVLREFNRVLKPGGRLLLVNMSKKDPEKPSWYEEFYRSMPEWFSTYILGGCRPVVMEKKVRESEFESITREFQSWPMFSEIIIANKRNRIPETGHP